MSSANILGWGGGGGGEMYNYKLKEEQANFLGGGGGGKSIPRGLNQCEAISAIDNIPGTVILSVSPNFARSSHFELSPT